MWVNFTPHCYVNILHQCAYFIEIMFTKVTVKVNWFEGWNNVVVFRHTVYMTLLLNVNSFYGNVLLWYFIIRTNVSSKTTTTINNGWEQFVICSRNRTRCSPGIPRRELLMFCPISLGCKTTIDGIPSFTGTDLSHAGIAIFTIHRPDINGSWWVK